MFGRVLSLNFFLLNRIGRNLKAYKVKVAASLFSPPFPLRSNFSFVVFQCPKVPSSVPLPLLIILVLQQVPARRQKCSSFLLPPFMSSNKNLGDSETCGDPKGIRLTRDEVDFWCFLAALIGDFFSFPEVLPGARTFWSPLLGTTHHPDENNTQK